MVVVESLIALEVGSVSACLGPLRPRAVAQLTRRKVDRNPVVDDARLETGIRVAERDCAAHNTVAVALSGGVCDEVSARAQLGSAWWFAQLAYRPPNLPRHSDTTTQ